MTNSRTLLWQPDLRARSGPRYLALIAALTDDMRAGRLHAGDRLPTHRDLAEALQLSLGTITRAYKEAEQSGLITSRVGRGTFVAAGSPANPLGLPSERLIEMSVDLPLHRHDPDLALALQRLARRDDLQQMQLGMQLRWDPRGIGERARPGPHVSASKSVPTTSRCARARTTR